MRREGEIQIGVSDKSIMFTTLGGVGQSIDISVFVY